MHNKPVCAVIGCHRVAADKHHVGGSGSPMIWLCRSCHGQIHGTVWSWVADHAGLTRAGVAKAKAEGRIGGNPGLRNGDQVAIRKASDGRRAAYLQRLQAGSDKWLPVVRSMRPHAPWSEVVRVLNAAGGSWTAQRLRLSLIALDETATFGRAPRTKGDDRLRRIVAAIATANPSLSLAQIASHLEDMGERTARGGSRWHASSVKHFLDRR